MWTDDAQIATRTFSVRTALERGNAICPSCLFVHVRAGQEHRRRPWSIAPRCIRCGDALLMPPDRQIVAHAGDA